MSSVFSKKDWKTGLHFPGGLFHNVLRLARILYRYPIRYYNSEKKVVKKMKKVLTLLVSILFVFAISSVSFAIHGTEPSETQKVEDQKADKGKEATTKKKAVKKKKAAKKKAAAEKKAEEKKPAEEKK
jgi:hypothetical protein